MYEMITNGGKSAALDPAGSLVDGDMGAWYTWLNERRLPEADRSSFLAWFEGYGTATAIGPGVEKNQEYHGPADMAQILARLA